MKLLTLFNASAAVLFLIVGVTLSNLSLTHAMARRREMAVRAALGAGRLRLVRQLLIDLSMVAVSGGAVGLFAAWVFIRGLAAYPATFVVPLDLSLGADGRLLLLAVTLSIIGAFGFGVVPAWVASRRSVTSALQDGGPTVGGPSRVVGRQILMGSQIALSVFALVAAGLFGRSLLHLSHADLGYDVENLWLASVDARRATFKATDEDDLGMATRLNMVDQIEAMPEVARASLSGAPPLSPFDRYVTVTPEGDSMEGPSATLHEIGPGYFSALDLSVTRGREFTNGAPDLEGAVILNRTLAEQLFAGRESLGRRVRIAGGSEQSARHVIGVVANAAHTHVWETDAPRVFVPIFRRPIRGETTLVIRTRGAGPDVGARLHQAITTFSDRVTVLSVRTMDDEIRSQLSRERLAAVLAAVLGGIAVILVAVGVSGLFGVIVQQRAREFGIRIALGADVNRIRRFVVRGALRVAVPGIGLGVVLWTVSHVAVASEIHGLASNDPLTISCAAAFVALIAVLAAARPAVRAARTAPSAVLRSE